MNSFALGIPSSDARFSAYGAILIFWVKPFAKDCAWWSFLPLLWRGRGWKANFCYCSTGFLLFEMRNLRQVVIDSTKFWPVESTVIQIRRWHNTVIHGLAAWLFIWICQVFWGGWCDCSITIHGIKWLESTVEHEVQRCWRDLFLSMHVYLLQQVWLKENPMYNSNVIPRVSHLMDVFESQSHVCTWHLIFLHHPIFWSKLLVLGRMGAPAPWSSRYVRLRMFLIRLQDSKIDAAGHFCYVSGDLLKNFQFWSWGILPQGDHFLKVSQKQNRRQ